MLLLSLASLADPDSSRYHEFIVNEFEPKIKGKQKSDNEVTLKVKFKHKAEFAKSFGCDVKFIQENGGWKIGQLPAHRLDQRAHPAAAMNSPPIANSRAVVGSGAVPA